MNKVYFLMLIAVMLAGVGDVLLSKGMKQVGAIQIKKPSDLFQATKRVVTNSWILLGTLMLMFFFALYLTSLSYADLSLVMPLTAGSYIVVALLAKIFLNEEVSMQRMLGIALISVGVALISTSAKTS